MTYTLWYSHDKVYKGEWQRLLTGLAGAVAAAELLARQDVTRRRAEPIRFKVLPDGEHPR